MKTTKIIPKDYLDRIICVAYGDADLIDKIKIYFEAKRNPAIKQVLDEYKETAKRIHKISREEYHGEAPVKEPRLSKWLLNYLYIFFRRPVIATAMSLIITAGIAGYFITNSNHRMNGYSEQELMNADQQAKESFALVASIFERTRNELKDQIFNEKINKPINNGLIIVNKYL